MDRLLKKVADLILIFVALLGLLTFLPVDIKGTDILIISGSILLIVLVALITKHVGRLEAKIEELIKDREIDKRLIKIENKLKL